MGIASPTRQGAGPKVPSTPKGATSAMEDGDEVEVEGGFESASEEAGRAKQNVPFPLFLCSFVPLFPGGMGGRRPGSPIMMAGFCD